MRTWLAARIARFHGWRMNWLLRKARRAEAAATDARKKAAWWWARAGPGFEAPDAE